MGKDYSDIGLNDNLTAKDSVANTGKEFISAYQFDNSIEASASKIPDSFRIVRSGTLSVTKDANSDQGLGSYTHNLGFTPVALVYLNDTFGNFYALPFVSDDNVSGIININWSYSTDTSQLVVSIRTPSAGSSYASALTRTFKYYLLRETAN